jgi:hypothetical protein
MDVDLTALPDDVGAQHRLIRDLTAERADERTALQQAQTEIERLRLIVQKLQRLQFGRRAERLDGGQLELGLEDLGADIAVPRNSCQCHLPGSRPPGLGRIGRAFPIIWSAKTCASTSRLRPVRAVAAPCMRSARR